jgi:UDP-N-acetylmuramate dehydrogenase
VRLTRDVPLAPLTTLGVGGRAAALAHAEHEDDVVAALALARDEGWPVLVLGGGSNVLVADEGFPGLVLRPAVRGVDEKVGAPTIWTVGAGEPWDALVARAVQRGLSGLECLSGIPGDVGGTPIQNVGAYGAEVSDTLVSVTLIERETGELSVRPASELALGYRTSALKHAEAERFVVTRVTFALTEAPPTLRYAELERALEGRAPSSLAGPAGLGLVRDAVLRLRRDKSMVLDPSDENTRSAGSFFTNPIVPCELADLARARLVDAGRLEAEAPMPRFAAALPGHVKLSAGWLIEHSGLARGTRHGHVGLSTKHALAIVTREGATARDVLDFALFVQRTVREATGVRLVMEPVPVGFAPERVAALS